MLLALIIVVSVLTYLYTAGSVGRLFLAAAKTRCPRCVRGTDRYGDRLCSRDHNSSAVFTGLAFPLTVPLFLGSYGKANVFGSSEAGSRDEKRRARELTEAKHKEELAKIQARTTRELERALED